MSAEVPKAPEEEELRNIIDKLAQFVARNGPEFEKMTKEKQKDNAKFQFLFGGEYYNYYQYKVNGEHAILRKQQQADIQIKAMAASVQLQSLQNQIAESERNLKAQHDVLMQQQGIQIEEAMWMAEKQANDQRASELSIDLVEFDAKLSVFMESCTKDGIANAKTWILNNFTSEDAGKVILNHVLSCLTDMKSNFTFRLHLLYLINDLLHHSMRKNATDFLSLLREVAVPLYCFAYHKLEDETQQDKMDKLVALWEKNAYFEEEVLEKLKNAVPTSEVLDTELMQKHAGVVNQIASAIQATYQGYETQHHEFCRHVQQQILALNQPAVDPQAAVVTMSTGMGTVPALGSRQPLASGRRSRFDVGGPNPNSSGSTGLLGNMPASMAGGDNNNGQMPQPRPLMQTLVAMGDDHHGRAGFGGPMPFGPRGPGMDGYPRGPPGPMGMMRPMRPPFGPGGMMGPNGQMHPPDGMPPMMPDQPPPSLIPTVPYYDLPAGLMVPLVKLEDCSYKGMDPRDVRLPPPMPPGDRLIAAIEAFYSQATHENPRDNDGWERLGLYEYYQAKERAIAEARKRRERDGTGQSASRSVSPPISDDVSSSSESSQSRSPSPADANGSGRRRSSRKSSSRRRRSRDHGGGTRKDGSRGGKDRSSRGKDKKKVKERGRYSSNSPSRAEGDGDNAERSRSGSRTRKRSGSVKSGSRSHSRSKSRSLSKTPPNITSAPLVPPPVEPDTPVGGAATPVGVPNPNPTTRLDESNRGHQLLKKMGWGGGGLGLEEQGITDPVKAGEIRDNPKERFKGLGQLEQYNVDPFEAFRMQRSKQYSQMTKTPAKERKKEKRSKH